MRSLKKNTQPIYYATYNKQITIYEKDSDGNVIYDDGVPIIAAETARYNNPVLFYANVSAGKGVAEEEVFGKDIDFTRAVSTTDKSLPLDELSLIWIENKPGYLEDGVVDPDSADYKIAAPVARSLNSLMIAIKAISKGKMIDEED